MARNPLPALPLLLLLLLQLLPTAHAWGTLGHETVALIAQNFVTSPTRKFCQSTLNDTSSSYLANVATWADSYRHTAAGEFSAPFHYIDAEDDPPRACGVDYQRDCGDGGCVVGAIANYVRVLRSLPLAMVDAVADADVCRPGGCRTSRCPVGT